MAFGFPEVKTSTRSLKGALVTSTATQHTTIIKHEVVKPGSKQVLKTFVRWFDQNGNVIGDYSLGLGLINVRVARRMATAKPHKRAAKFQVFTATANVHGRPRIIEESMDALTRVRTLPGWTNA